ncbi:MAG TPA: helix-turn-helix transcriptional regulator [Bacilli bacterium]|nr:helix-turn-helix transcriptional regulator [Bacilli bacterium]
MIDMKAVGNKICYYRNENAMSQNQIAEQLFVSRQAISQWELGNALPSIDNLIELAKIFHTSFEDLLCLNEKVKIDADDFFSGHSRDFIIRKIVDGSLKVDLVEKFYLFSSPERMIILKAIKEKKITINYDKLRPRLAQEEQVYLDSGVSHNGTIRQITVHR